MEFSSFNKYVEKSIRENWNRDALSDYMGATQQYKDVARKIEKLHILFENSGVKKGDKIALCGRNCAHWGIAFLATMSYGAVAVPILHEFKSEQIHHIVNHSDAKLLFCGDAIWPTISMDEMPQLEGVICVQDFSLYGCRSEKLQEAREHLNELFGKKYPNRFLPSDVNYYADEAEEMAMINYTSGTTSMSKGVMIPYRALWSNLEFAFEVLGKQIKKGDKVVSILPMAHMYGMAFEFIFEFCAGVHVYYLTKLPSPKIIFNAFSEIKPRIIIAVPLVIEKIIRKAVLPKLQTNTMQALLKVPVLSQKIRDKIRQQVYEAFGGNFYEIIIGGAAFNGEIESFLKEIGLPFTVGYGTTECAPIIGYEDYQKFQLGSCGKIAPRMQVRINSSDPLHKVGEILVKGANVMLGYYKNEEATAQVLDADGWYHTGDLGLLDAAGNIYIKGRNKNMLLAANGQNVYPEEVEDKLNALPYVAESIMIQKGDKFYALVHPDYDAAQAAGLDAAALEAQMEQNRKDLNTTIPAYEQITAFKLYKEEFEKTPKKSIKRFLYADAEI